MTSKSAAQPEIVRQFFQEEAFDGSIGELLAALEGPQESPLTIEQQAHMLALLWELGGHLEMLREDMRYSKHIRIYKLMHRAIMDVYTVVPLTDEGMAAAGRVIDAMPEDSARRQAIAFKQAKHAAYAQKRGFQR